MQSLLRIVAYGFIYGIAWSVWSTSAWANFTVVSPHDVDASALTQEAKVIVSDLLGVTVAADRRTVMFKKLNQDVFTDQQRIQLRQALADHDVVVVQERRRQEHEETEIPIESFGGGAAGALAVLAGRGLVLRVRKKKPTV